MAATVLAIDDDRSIQHLIQRALEPLGMTVHVASSAVAGLEAIRELKPDVVLLDIILPRMSGLEVFREIRDLDRRLPVIFMTAEAGSETAIEAMRLGAYDYVAKPLDLPGLTALVVKALETRRLMSVPVAVSVVEDERNIDGGDLFIGRSPLMLSVFKEIGRFAQQNVTVLIRGESGTGKELVARAIYQFSNRSKRPFMAVNCAALPDTLLESELFGHEKGSFTGADRCRIGKFEQCNGGTLFLDEVGDMSPLTQGKVLRLLQEQKFERVGGNETIETNVRLVAATNRNLEEMVRDGRFRGDLFYRLNVVTVQLPPLRDRAADIPLLLQYFVSRARMELGKTNVEGISSDALKLLEAYPWPGNIRELQSVVRQSLLKSTGPVIVPDFLPEAIRNPGSAPPVAVDEVPSLQHWTPPEEDANGNAAPQRAGEAPLEPAIPSVDGVRSDLKAFVNERLMSGSHSLYAESLEMMERFLLTRVLQVCDGNQSRAAEILGITRGKVRDRIASFGISVGKSVTIESST